MKAAERIEQSAAEWLNRREDPEWSPAEETELQAWLDQSLEHRVAFWRLEEGWRRVDRLAALRPAASIAAARRRAPWRQAAAIAAGLAVLGVAATVGLEASRPRLHSYATDLGGHETLPLPDGSRAELSTATEIRTAFHGGRREVWLDRGEAYFEVKKDPAHPFVVWAGPRRITVLGTRFSVRRDGDRVRVAVVEGRVRVDPVRPRTEAKAAVVTAGDMVLAQGASTLVTPPSPERVEDALSWRKGMLTFDQATLAEAAAEFNRFNSVKLHIGDAAAAQTRIGGSFQASKVEAFASLLHTAYGLKVTQTPDAIEVSS